MGQTRDVPLVGAQAPRRSVSCEPCTSGDLVAVRGALGGGTQVGIFLLEGIGVVPKVVGTGLIGILLIRDCFQKYFFTVAAAILHSFLFPLSPNRY